MDDIDEPNSRPTLSDGSILTELSIRSAAQYTSTSAPTILCFHGSGENAHLSWNELQSQLVQEFRIVLFARPQQVDASTHTQKIHNYLHSAGLHGPFILLAHSYGGFFAKQFLVQYPDSVTSVVLVETGKAAIPSDRAWQNASKAIETKPVVVISANPRAAKRKQLQLDPNTSPDQWSQLEAIEQLDGVMEKEQLKMSTNAKHVQLNDCGHNVIRDRPAVVLAEVKSTISGFKSNVSATPGPSAMSKFKNIFSRKKT